MKRATEIVTMFVFAVAAETGCVGQSRVVAGVVVPGLNVPPQVLPDVVVPGMANAPILTFEENPTFREDDANIHDSIANGNDACPTARGAARETLWNQFPPCPGTARRDESTAPASGSSERAPSPSPSARSRGYHVVMALSMFARTCSASRFALSRIETKSAARDSKNELTNGSRYASGRPGAPNHALLEAHPSVALSITKR